jgi:LmbE family N-acetylglucosaminyl deacetylase
LGSVYLFLCPHLDDGVLSCGGLIHQLAQTGARVILATVFTADAPEAKHLTWLARRNLDSWQLGDAPFAVRCQEDFQAARVIGAEAVHLGFLDAMFRLDSSGKPFYLHQMVEVPLCPKDEHQTGQLIQQTLGRLTEQLNLPADARIFSPMGAGGHVDHILVRRAVEAVFPPEQVNYYEDFPYVLRASSNGPIQAPPGQKWVVTTVPLSPSEMDARIAAASCYTSQLPGLFPSRIDCLIEIARAHLPWVRKILHRRSSPQSASRRMAGLIRRHVAQIGGERYWVADE